MEIAACVASKFMSQPLLLFSASQHARLPALLLAFTTSCCQARLHIGNWLAYMLDQGLRCCPVCKLHIPSNAAVNVLKFNTGPPAAPEKAYIRVQALVMDTAALSRQSKSLDGQLANIKHLSERTQGQLVRSSWVFSNALGIPSPLADTAPEC